MFAEVEADQERNDAGDHETQAYEVKFTDVFSPTLSLMRVEVKEHEQKEAGKPASWPSEPSTKMWTNRK